MVRRRKPVADDKDTLHLSELKRLVPKAKEYKTIEVVIWILEEKQGKSAKEEIKQSRNWTTEA